MEPHQAGLGAARTVKVAVGTEDLAFFDHVVRLRHPAVHDCAAAGLLAEGRVQARGGETESHGCWGDGKAEAACVAADIRAKSVLIQNAIHMTYYVFDVGSDSGSHVPYR